MKKFRFFSVLANLLFILVKNLSTADWKLSNPPWACDKSCLRNISLKKLEVRDCLQRKKENQMVWRMLGVNEDSCKFYKNVQEKRCVRNVSGQYFLSSCEVNVTDYRIPCRKASDSMTWYRGPQSVSFSGKRCKRWDIYGNDYSPSSFGSYDAPSLAYENKRRPTLHSHEERCRNPDNWVSGPWCFITTEKNETEREACFATCNSYKEPETCLAKMLFPYALHTKSAFSDLPSFQPNQLNEIKDLSDILDVPKVSRFNLLNRPMFAPKYYLYNIRYHKSDISTRLRCFQTGPQTRIAGPWIYTETKSHPFADHAIWLDYLLNDVGGDQIDRDMAIRDDISPYYSLWRPCFLACEDTNINCWPVAQKTVQRRRFPYYGPKSFDLEGNKCISPNYAFQILLMQRQKGSMTAEQGIYLRILRDHYLYDKKNQTRIRNLFAISYGYNMISNRCFTLGDFLRGKDVLARQEISTQNEILKVIMSIGAGCFIETIRLEQIGYRKCFESCSCDKPIKEPEFKMIDCALMNECVGEEDLLMDRYEIFSISNISIVDNLTSSLLIYGNYLNASIYLLAFMGVTITILAIRFMSPYDFEKNNAKK